MLCLILKPDIELQLRINFKIYRVHKKKQSIENTGTEPIQAFETRDMSFCQHFFLDMVGYNRVIICECDLIV